MDSEVSSIVSIGFQTWSDMPPFLHVHSYLRRSKLLVTHVWQNRISPQQYSHSSSSHGHESHLREFQ